MKKVQTPLFQGITENEWNEMQNCSCMRQQSFEKNELIFRMGESVREIGIEQNRCAMACQGCGIAIFCFL